MKTFEFTEESCDLLTQCIRHRIDYLHETNRIFMNGAYDDIVKEKCSQNIVKIGKLKTLLNYINS